MPDSKEVNKDTDFMSMSDDDIMNMSEPDWENLQEEESEDDQEKPIEEEKEEESEDNQEEKDNDEEDDTNNDSEDSDSDDSKESDSDSDSDSSISSSDDESDDASGSDNKNKAEQKDKQWYKRKIIIDGKEIEIDSEEEAEKLIQMGISAKSNEREVTEAQSISKMLKKQKITSDDLNLFISAKNGDVDAIKAIMDMNEIDPLNVPVDDNSEYKPTDYSVPEVEVATDRVIDGLKNSEHFNAMADAVQFDFDAESKNIIAQNPFALKIIHDNIESGIHDKAISIVNKKRIFGSTDGKSKLQMYDEAVTLISSNSGKDKKLDDKTSNKAKLTKKPAMKNRAKQSGGSSSGGSSSSDADYLGMSDEEFIKLGDIY